VSNILERQVVLFIDLLGFSETAYRAEPKMQSNVLALLTSIASLKSDFVSSATKTDNGTTHNVRPSVSTFSDHIVASYSLARIEADNDRTRSFIIFAHLQDLIGRIAVAALSMGFLVRGGIATGNLFHSGGVVFGEALIEAVTLEARTAIYPRVVASDQSIELFGPSKNFCMVKDFDGIFCVDYYRDCLLKAVQPGESYAVETRRWMSIVCETLQKNLNELKEAKHTNQHAKWVYFTRKIQEAVTKLPAEVRDAFGVDPSLLPEI
jgi:hypothetical protein